MQRRDFLRLGGVGCAAMATVGALPGRDLLRTPASRVHYRPSWDRPEVDATTLRSGAQEIARAGARVSVLGFAPGDRAWPGRASLDVHFPQNGWHAPFHAWTHDGRQLSRASSAASFVVPLDEQGQLTLEPAWNQLGYPVSLSAGSSPDLPKLRRGIYLLSAATAPPLVVAIAAADDAPSPVAPWRTDHV